jgi:hypothetical protein
VLEFQKRRSTQWLERQLFSRGGDPVGAPLYTSGADG